MTILINTQTNEIFQGKLDTELIGVENYPYRKATQTEIEAIKSKEEELQAKNFLDETDWMTIRHRDQVALGINTSLTQAEYENLLLSRQEKRDIIN